MEAGLLESSRQAVARLRAGMDQRRRGEAEELEAICELAVSYRVDDEELMWESLNRVGESQKYLSEKSTTLSREGLPEISEFLHLEVAAILRCSSVTALEKITTALDLKYRHPVLFEAVINCEIECWVASKAAWLCRGLSPMQAEAVTTRWVPIQYGLTPGAALKELKKLVIRADRKAAREKEAAERADRGVWVREIEGGVASIGGRLDALEGRIVDVRLNQIARRLKARFPELDHHALRAKAMVLAMDPSRLVEMLAHPVPDDGQDSLDLIPAHDVRGEVEIVVHIQADAKEHLDGVASIERAGALTSDLLGELLGQGYLDGDFKLKVQPVIDLNNFEVCDEYRPSERMRRAVRLAQPTEVFPFSNRTRCRDLDHADPYVPGGRGQTRLDNLASESRRVHRAKTAGIWVLDQQGAGHFRWTSPLGYVYEVTGEGSYLAYTPDLGPAPPDTAAQDPYSQVLRRLNFDFSQLPRHPRAR